MANLVVAGGIEADPLNGGAGVPLRPDIDTVGLWLAQVWAQRGTCARRLVGCVLIDSGTVLLGAGYNGPPTGIPNCRLTGRDGHLAKHTRDRNCPGAKLPTGTGLSQCEAVHAEANALIRCNHPELIYSVYVTTSPCIDCVKLISNTAARRIVFVERYAHDEAARNYWFKTRGETNSWVHMPQSKLEFPYVR